ncbi:MAG: hypothetical protein GTN70_02485 [Deltaproteobacteria bacterium]|nr:hypothetical protein [Deltaproteobacteria bacterium]NIS76511.1 hypothetical protein [Deltaproteobacteria bacterium]
MKAKNCLLLCVLLVSVLIIPAPARAFLNNFDTAAISDQGKWKGKLGITSSDNFFALFVGGNYGIQSGFEVTGRGGVLNSDVDEDETGLLLGIGGRYKAAFFANPNYPDFALQATYDLGFADGSALHSIAAAALVSKEVTAAESKHAITPYGGPEIEVMGGSLNDDTDVNFHLTLGTEFLLDRQFGIIFEGKIGGGSSVGLAVSYKF